MSIHFDDIEPYDSSIIMVIGVGGGGGNAVNHMYKLGIADVSFMVCNTDRQALERSPITNKVRLGDQELGAGNDPEAGRLAAEASIEEVKEILRDKNIRMVFITAGMGGGTGTGAAPVIARAAKEMGILTVAIVTIPFKTEGPRRVEQAIEGITAISRNVDSLLVVDNENILEIYGDLAMSKAFGMADDILASAAKGIAEIITKDYLVNVDFADVRTIMTDSGIALMGSARGNGPERVEQVARQAMASPLLNHKEIKGAHKVLLNITSGPGNEVTMSEAYRITELVQQLTGNNDATNIIWGGGVDDSLGEDLCITVVATGFELEDSISDSIKKRYPNVLKPVHPTITQPAPRPQRETVSLEDDDDAGKKPVQAPPAPDELGVVTHSSSGSPSGDDGWDDPQPAPVPPVRQRIGEDGPAPHTAPHAEQPISVQVPQTEPVPAQAGYTPEPPVAPSGGSPEPARYINLTEEELDIPAYIRRQRKIESEAPAGKVSREKLEGEAADKSTVKPDNELF